MPLPKSIFLECEAMRFLEMIRDDNNCSLERSLAQLTLVVGQVGVANCSKFFNVFFSTNLVHLSKY